MMKKMTDIARAASFPILVGSVEEKDSYFTVPNILYSADEFRDLSAEAKILYARLRNRTCLSVENGWKDAEGKIYVYYTIKAIMKDLGCGNKKAGQLLAELDDCHGIGLISRVRQGLGKPDRIYVQDCYRDSGDHCTVAPDDPEAEAGDGEIVKDGAGEACSKTSSLPVKACPDDLSERVNVTFQGEDVSRDDFSGCTDHISGGSEKKGADLPECHTNYINPIVSDHHTGEYESMVAVPVAAPVSVSVSEEDRTDGWDRTEEYRACRAYFEEQCCADLLRRNDPMHRDMVSEILDIIVDTCCSRKEFFRVRGEDVPAGVVRSRLMKLNYDHIRYVMERMNANTTDIRNIRQYLLTALFNSVSTIENYYRAQANHDMYGGGAD